MAAIIRRQTQQGTSYKFQVKIKNPLTGEFIPKSKTWAVPQGMNEKQAEREAVIRAAKFEEEIRAIHNNFNPAGTLTPDSTFKEAKEAYLKKLERLTEMVPPKLSLNHFENMKDYFAVCTPIDKYKVSKITPGIVQNFFDYVDSRKYTKRAIRSKPADVKAMMKLRGVKYIDLRQHLPQSTLCIVINGKANISLETATLVATVLQCDVHKIFSIQEQEIQYSWKTNSHIKVATCSVLGFCKKLRIVQDNYATSSYIDHPEKDDTEVKCMDDIEVMRAYRTILNWHDIRMATATLTLIFTGFRKGEACELDWSVVDVLNREIEVKKSVTQVRRRGLIVGAPKTKRSKRTTEIPTLLNDQLIKYKAWYDEQKQIMGDRWAENQNHLFINMDTGKRINPRTLNEWLSKILKAAGVEHYTVHQMRHTNITQKLLNNVPVLEVAGDAGHAQPSTTMNIYGHFLKKHKGKSAQVLDNVFKLPMGM